MPPNMMPGYAGRVQLCLLTVALGSSCRLCQRWRAPLGTVGVGPTCRPVERIKGKHLVALRTLSDTRDLALSERSQVSVLLCH